MAKQIRSGPKKHTKTTGKGCWEGTRKPIRVKDAHVRIQWHDHLFFSSYGLTHNPGFQRPRAHWQWDKEMSRMTRRERGLDFFSKTS